MTPEGWDRLHELGDVVAVDVASFFVFTAILLDVLAKAVQAFGGRARGTDLKSHHRLVLHLRKYATATGLGTPSQELIDEAQVLYDRVTLTRSKVFIHHESWREMLGGYAISAQGATLSLGYTGDLETHGSRDAFWTRSRALLTPVPVHLAHLPAVVRRRSSRVPRRVSAGA